MKPPRPGATDAELATYFDTADLTCEVERAEIVTPHPLPDTPTLAARRGTAETGDDDE